MASEAALPALGWLALSSLPAVGFWLDRKVGLAIGAISAAFISAGPLLASVHWNGNDASLVTIFQGTGYILALAFISLFSWPFGLLENGTAAIALLFLATIAVAVMLQIVAMRWWQKKGLLVALGFEAVVLGSYWIFRARYMPLEIELGYTGILEALAYMNSLMVCTFSAFGITAVAKYGARKTSVLVAEQKQ